MSSGSKYPVSFSLTILSLVLVTTFTGAEISSKKLKIRKFHIHQSLTPNNPKRTNQLSQPSKNGVIDHDLTTCNLSQQQINEIWSYEKDVNKIIEVATNGIWKGRTFRNLTTFVDKFGHRLSGTQTLENSIDYILKKMQQGGFITHEEKVMVPHWVRGEEKATLLKPRVKNLPILGLGASIGTGTEGITADVFVVTSFEELKANAANASGKIVVFNQQGWTTYGNSLKFRTKGASEAAKVGAVAALIRSITPFSLNNPHTGANNYDDNVNKIPAACITIEDAELLYRMQQSGEQLRIHLKMLDYNLPDTTSKNGIIELLGTTYPNQAVIVSGHIDSWDVGQGAMDDGGGIAISWEALSLLKHLGLIPKRTLRAIMWTSEEPGNFGAIDYARRHKDEANNIVAAFESDLGTFTPKGLDFAGTKEAGCIVNEIPKFFRSINATQYQLKSTVSSDIGELIKLGIPGLENANARQNQDYFWYHHTEADTMTMMDSVELDKNLALWAGAAYIIADLTNPLPRQSPWHYR